MFMRVGKILPLPFLGLGVAVSLVLSSCSQADKSIQPSPATPDVAQSFVSASPSQTASPLIAASSGTFHDIQGVFGEQKITQLSQLGVFDMTTGNFNPQQPVTRVQFVRWLFRANNAIYAKQPGKLVRPAETSEATFPDVPPTHPDFRYIQGMANAGFAVGYDEKTFKPDQPLTREEMIGIKAGFDWGGVDKNLDSLTGEVPPWSDRDQISKRFIPSFNVDFNTGNNIKNVERTFGALKTFKPHAPVTRAEAAVCISVVGDHTKYATARSAQQALAEGTK